MTSPSVSRHCSPCTQANFAEITSRHRECKACGRWFCPNHLPRNEHDCQGAGLSLTKGHLITDPLEAKDYQALVEELRLLKNRPDLDVAGRSSLALRVWQKLVALTTVATTDSPPEHLNFIPPAAWAGIRIKAAEAAQAYAELLSLVNWP